MTGLDFFNAPLPTPTTTRHSLTLTLTETIEETLPHLVCAEREPACGECGACRAIRVLADAAGDARRIIGRPA